MHGDTKLQVTGENNGSGPRVRGATSPRGRESINIHPCTVPAVNNAGSTTGCRDAIDEYNSFFLIFFYWGGGCAPSSDPSPHPTTSLLQLTLTLTLTLTLLPRTGGPADCRVYNAVQNADDDDDDNETLIMELLRRIRPILAKR